MMMGNAPRVRTLDELLNADFPVREHLIDPWLRQGESAMIWAAAGTGKTMLALTLALMVAGGGGALGWTNKTPRKVLYVDGEMAREDLQERAAMLMDTIEGIDAEAALTNLRFMARTWQDDGAGFPDLNDREAAEGRPSGQDFVFQRARALGADLVFLDNLSTLAEIADENDAGAIAPTLRFLMRLKAARIATVLVHHSGKSGESYRGSSQLATTFEVILGLKADSELEVTGGAAFTTEWSKYRGERGPSVRPKGVRLARGEDGRPAWVVEESAAEKWRPVVDAIRSCRFMDQRSIAAELGLSTADVTRRKQEAIRAGAITQVEISDCFASAVLDVPGNAF